MGEVKKILGKISGGKKLGKDQCLILILAGILLCVISLPVEKDKSKSDLLDESGTIMKNEHTFDKEEISRDYVTYWEEKLEESLQCVEGAGEVRVLIYTGGSGETILARDGSEEFSDTTETDAAGGSRHISENRLDKTVVRTVDERGQNVPLVVRTVAPDVEGVLVIAQGADRQQVRRDIIEAIQVLFDVDMNRISIIKMKTNNQ